jgi:actin-like ATPase involved in cell morphogenesis
MNHPAGQKILSISFGSDEIKVIALAMILWVMSDLLVIGNKLDSENKQFV